MKRKYRKWGAFRGSVQCRGDAYITRNHDLDFKPCNGDFGSCLRPSRAVPTWPGKVSDASSARDDSLGYSDD